MNYFKAKAIADRIIELLSPHCEIIHIAGSVRREKIEVKDIEVCCIPKETFVSTDLFGGGKNIRVPEFEKTVGIISKEIVKGNILTGRYVQLILKGGDELKLDLFMPEKNDYYRQYAIRTGSADYSAKEKDGVLTVKYKTLKKGERIYPVFPNPNNKTSTKKPR